MKRIEQLANLATGNSAIDIGTDHGYLLIELLNRNFTNLLAVEKNKGPLDNFIDNITQLNIKKSFKYKLSDGLNDIDVAKCHQFENIYIAGMGGNLIVEIINNDLEKFKNSYLILQPNNNEPNVRKFLCNNMFQITKEIIIKDNKKFYEVIVAKYKKDYKYVPNETELLFGIKMNKHINEFKEKWIEEEAYLSDLISELENKDIHINKNLIHRLNLIKKEQ